MKRLLIIAILSISVPAFGQFVSFRNMSAAFFKTNGFKITPDGTTIATNNDANAFTFKGGLSSQGLSNSGEQFGLNASANGSQTLAVGNSANTSNGNGSVAVGPGATTSTNKSVAVGEGATGSNTNTVAVGEGASASGGNSIAIGQNASATGSNSVAIGQGVASTVANTITLGSNTQTNVVPGAFYAQVFGTITNNVSISNALNNAGVLLGTNGNVSASGTVSAAAFATSGNGSILSTDPSGNSLTYTNGWLQLSNAATHNLNWMSNGFYGSDLTHGIRMPTNAPTDAQILTATGTGGDTKWGSAGAGGTVVAGQNINVTTNGSAYTPYANGLLFSQFTDTNNVGAAEQTLWTNTLPANILTNNGDCIRIHCWAVINTSETHNLKFYIGTTSLSINPSAWSTDADYTINAIRVTSTTWRGQMTMVSGSGGGKVANAFSQSDVTGVDFTTAQGIGITVTSTTSNAFVMKSVQVQKLIGTGY